MELKIGTRVRYKDAVGVIIDAPSYIDLYRVDFGVKVEWLEPKDLEAVENGDA